MAALRRDAILKAVRKNDRKIRGFGVSRIGLFGSYVRGEEKRGSDVDLLVEFEKGSKTFDNYMGAKFFLEDLRVLRKKPPYAKRLQGIPLAGNGTGNDLVIDPAGDDDLRRKLGQNRRHAVDREGYYGTRIRDDRLVHDR